METKYVLKNTQTGYDENVLSLQFAETFITAVTATQSVRLELVDGVPTHESYELSAGEATNVYANPVTEAVADVPAPVEEAPVVEETPVAAPEEVVVEPTPEPTPEVGVDVAVDGADTTVETVVEPTPEVAPTE